MPRSERTYETGSNSVDSLMGLYGYRSLVGEAFPTTIVNPNRDEIAMGSAYCNDTFFMTGGPGLNADPGYWEKGF